MHTGHTCRMLLTRWNRDADSLPQNSVTLQYAHKFSQAFNPQGLPAKIWIHSFPRSALLVSLSLSEWKIVKTLSVFLWQARPLRTNELSDPVLSQLVAEKLAQIHMMDVPINKEPRWLWDTMYRWRLHDYTLLSQLKQVHIKQPTELSDSAEPADFRETCTAPHVGGTYQQWAKMTVHK